MIKKSSHVLFLSPVLANYFNKLMPSGTFPDVLKVELERITPIFKNDNPECIKNYRPNISTLLSAYIRPVARGGQGFMTPNEIDSGLHSRPLCARALCHEA